MKYIIFFGGAGGGACKVVRLWTKEGDGGELVVDAVVSCLMRVNEEEVGVRARGEGKARRQKRARFKNGS